MAKGGGSLRCTLCGIDYPPVRDFLVCPIHQEETTPNPGHEPDADWRERAQRLYQQLKGLEKQEYRPYPAVQDVRVHDESGVLFVYQTDLIHAGLRIPVSAPSFQLFELDGAVYETQGWDNPRRRWWIDLVAEAE